MAVVIPAQAGIQNLFNTRSKATGLLASSMTLALRAIGCADVRFGILPPQSGLRRNDE